mmetsp:Transcript_612/g.814  ORF Transcript_612/g.814 Transcript_612/m.814 type:complete len:136 (-) Transcript_612:125-532(-)|eukprot:CAMPEP_0175104520 /NCGR_PEP_ID=MMETSP0086_2-20121207/9794_1 /TAXON_ID=136419 /ORGANISM="Unknown Unknown, Strain D1" /LENGTH=135 /DNA_ID=CAMNT_0016379963 /DNA_START=34 /DNA_END=441 /DNA_ORIENTATION=+
MGHGNFSDFGALFWIATGLVNIIKPEINYMDIGPMKGYMSGTPNENERTLCLFSGIICLIMGGMLFTVKWNSINGKLPAVGFLGLSIYSVYHAYVIVDNNTFVLRPFYVLAAVCFMLFVHLINRPAADAAKSKAN